MAALAFLILTSVTLVEIGGAAKLPPGEVGRGTKGRSQWLGATRGWRWPESHAERPAGGNRSGFDVQGTPDRCLNSAEATDASASTLASAFMRAWCVGEKSCCLLRDFRCSGPVADLFLFLFVSSRHLQNTSFCIGDAQHASYVHIDILYSHAVPLTNVTNTSKKIHDPRQRTSR